MIKTRRAAPAPCWNRCIFVGCYVTFRMAAVRRPQGLGFGPRTRRAADNKTSLRSVSHTLLQQSVALHDCPAPHVKQHSQANIMNSRRFTASQPLTYAGGRSTCVWQRRVTAGAVLGRRRWGEGWGAKGGGGEHSVVFSTLCDSSSSNRRALSCTHSVKAQKADALEQKNVLPAALHYRDERHRHD